MIDDNLREGIIIYDKQNLRYECILCKKPLTGEAPVNQHLSSKGHLENGAKYAVYAICELQSAPSLLLKLLPTEVKVAAEKGVIKVEQLPEGMVIRCLVCELKFTGVTPMKQHLSGGPHIKNLARKSSGQGFSDTNSDILPNPQEVSSGTYAATSSNAIHPSLRNVYSVNLYGNETRQIPFTPSVSNALGRFNSSESQVLQQSNEISQALQSSMRSLRVSDPQSYHSASEGLRSSEPPPQVFSQSTRYTNVSHPNQSRREDHRISEPALPHLYSQISRSTNSTGESSSIPSNTLARHAQETTEDNVIEWDNGLKMYHCNLCHLSFPQIEPHEKNKCHKEKAIRHIIRSEGKIPQSLLKLLPPCIIEAARTCIIKEDGDNIMCRYCQKPCNGIITLENHLNGTQHSKKISRFSLSGVQLNNSSQHSTPELQTYLERPSDSDIDNCKAVAAGEVEENSHCSDQIEEDERRCKACDIGVNSLKNLEKHYKSSEHKMQLQKRYAERQQPSSERQPGRSSTTTEMNVPPEPYSVQSTPRGHVHIFNYMFLGRTTDPKERKGAKHDTEKLMDVFIQMGYEVYPHENLTANETKATIEEIRQDEKLREVDTLVMFFLSHGVDTHKFLANDKRRINLREDIWDKFTDTACPFMKMKPKIIFANFCRGQDKEMEEELETDSIRDIPRDLVTIHATHEDITAPRKPSKGTHFIRALCEVLWKHAKKQDLRTMYEILDSVCKSIGGRQPKWEDDRFRKFYFNPIEDSDSKCRKIYSVSPAALCII